MSEVPWVRISGLPATAEKAHTDDVQPEVMRLFHELRVPLLRYLGGVGLSQTDGEDVVQETFLALHRHLRAGKPRDNLTGWIFRVARNLGLKHRQRHGPSVEPDGAHTPADPSPNPEERAARVEQEKAIRAVVAALPELDRQCLLLRAEGLRYREIAQALEVSVGTVAQALARALDRLARVARR